MFSEKNVSKKKLCPANILVQKINPCKKILGEPSKQKMSQIVEKVHKEEGGQSQNQNSLHFKCRLF